MRVFVTGATGYVGAAVAGALSRAGHQVYGLCRSEQKARRLAGQEIIPVMGSMQEPDSYLPTADQCQVLIHCAAEMSAEYMALDEKTVQALIRSTTAAHQPRLLVYTSGVWLYGDTGASTVDESSALNPMDMVKPRVEHEEQVLAADQNGVRAIVIRPGCVYGGRGGLTGSWFETAAQTGAARVIGDGAARWAMIHHDDLADLYVRAVESPYGRVVFNAAGPHRFTTGECAAAASHAAGAGGKVLLVPVEEAAKQMGPFAECLAITQHVDASKAQRLLGWHARHPGFVDGVFQYYAAWEARKGGAE